MPRVQALPGMTAAYGPPPSGSFTGRFVAFGQENGPLADAQAYAVDPDYFRVAGIRLKEGRGLQAGDTTTSPPVAVIDEARCIGCTKCIQACPVEQRSTGESAQHVRQRFHRDADIKVGARPAVTARRSGPGARRTLSCGGRPRPCGRFTLRPDRVAVQRRASQSGMAIPADNEGVNSRVTAVDVHRQLEPVLQCGP